MIESNYSLTRLFLTHDITVVIDGKNFTMHLPSIRDLYLERDWNMFYHILNMGSKELTNILHLKEDLSSLKIINLILGDLGQFPQYNVIYNALIDKLPLLLPEYKWDSINKQMKIGSITITDEIWDYIIYLVKLSSGEKVTKPLVFTTEEERQFYMAQKAYEEKLNKIKSSNAKNNDEDSLIKAMLSIVYAFPSLTFDYLADQTMAQIQWLQKHAAGAVSYEVNARAFAAGNIKKGSKLEFFIK